MNELGTHIFKHVATATIGINAGCMVMAQLAGTPGTFAVGLVGAGFAGYARIYFKEYLRHMKVTGYRDVAMELRYDISTDALPTGSQLPSQRQLADRYGVARKTVIRALQLLQEEGLVDIVHGRGTYVAGPDAADRITRAGHIEDHILHNAALGLTIDRADSLAITWTISPSTVRRVLARLTNQGVIRRRRDGRYEAA